MTKIRRMRIGLWALAALLSACACTQIGCDNRVEFHLARDLVAGSAYDVEACVDDDCGRATLTVATEADLMTGADGLQAWVDDDRIVLKLEQSDLAEARDVSLVVRDADQVVAEFAGTASFSKSTPNGVLCGPTCWHSVIDVPDR